MAGPALAGLFLLGPHFIHGQHSTMPIILSEKDREALHLVKGLIENTGVHFTIPQLVRKSGLNADKLKKGFKEMFGMPVHRYHLHFKISAAKKMLVESTLQVSEIAYALGYEDANNFSAAFKKVVGMRPGEWRYESKRQEKPGNQ
jgi:AraC family transcriptional activator of pyochelin receptor